MTPEEKKLLQNSARLCGQRKRLLMQIENERKKLVTVPYVNRRLEEEAKKYVEEQSGKTRLGSAIKATLLACVPLLGALIPHPVVMLLCVVAATVVFYVSYVKLEKNAKQRMKKQFIDEHTKSFEAERAQKLAYNSQIQKNITKIQQTLAAVEQSLQDPAKCCLHRDYWYAGEEIYRLVENGRAETLKEAINLFENVHAQAAERAERERKAEEARWAELEKMMNEGYDKYDEQKRKHWEEYRETALEVSLTCDD